MAEGMFGAPIGQSAAIGDQMNLLQMGQAEQLFPAKLETERQHGRFYGAQADVKELQADTQRRLATAFQRLSAGGSDLPLTGSPTDQLDKNNSLFLQGSRLALEAGDTLTASRLHTAGSVGAERAAQARVAEERATTVHATRQGRALDSAIGMLRGATTPEALATLQTQLPQILGGLFPEQEVAGVLQILQQSGGDPRVLDGIARGMLTEKDRLLADARDRNYASLARRRASAESVDAVRKDVLKKSGQLLDARRERLTKAGGDKAFKEPTNAEIAAGQDLIKKDFPDIDEKDLTNEARALQGRVQQLMREHPGLDAPTARAQAYQEARTAGDFEAYQMGGLFGIGGKKGTRAEPGGKSAATAIQPPTDTKQFREGRYYSFDEGVKMFTGGDPTDPENWDDPEDAEED